MRNRKSNRKKKISKCIQYFENIQFSYSNIVSSVFLGIAIIVLILSCAQIGIKYEFVFSKLKRYAGLFLLYCVADTILYGIKNKVMVKIVACIKIFIIAATIIFTVIFFIGALLYLLAVIVFLILYCIYLDWAHKNKDKWWFKIIEFVIFPLLILIFFIMTYYLFKSIPAFKHNFIFDESIILMSLILATVVADSLKEYLFGDYDYNILFNLVLVILLIVSLDYINILRIVMFYNSANSLIVKICQLIIDLKNKYNITELFTIYSFFLVVLTFVEKRISLIPIGFYNEFKRTNLGNYNKLSNYIHLRNYTKNCKSKIIDYLNNGVLVERGFADKDFINPKISIPYKNDILSDGIYAWYRHLSYYIDKYDLKLDDRFLSHIKNSNYCNNFNFSKLLLKIKYIMKR